MTDQDKNKPTEANSPGFEDDLESLSAEEKAAFEKIMSQIEDANGDDASDPPADTTHAEGQSDKDDSAAQEVPAKPAPGSGSEDETPTAEKQEALDNSASQVNAKDESDNPELPENSSSDPSNGDELTDDQQAALDKIMSEIKGGDDADDPPVAQDDDPGASVGDELTDDQQAALDKIMSEIKGGDDADDPPEAKDDEPGAADGDELTDDQQAALDNIMSETKGDDDTDDPPEAKDDDPGTVEGDELTDDQQAALDKIMSEINNDDETDDPQAAQDDAADAANGDELTDDQQAALDKIMSEINGDDETDDPPASQDDADAASGDAQTDDQQAELDSIMAEIGGDGDTEAVDQPSADNIRESSETSRKEKAPENLTLDEFNTELNNLLGASQEDDTKPQDDIDASEDEPEKASQSDQGYAMLQEVQIDETTPPKGSKPTPRSIKPKSWRRLSITAAVAVSLLIGAAGAYCGYLGWQSKTVAANVPDKPQIEQPPLAPNPFDAQPKITPMDPRNSTDDPLQVKSLAAAQPTPCAALRSDLAAARQQLQNKLDEINDLKSYYRKGINEERSKIEAIAPAASALTFKKALADRRIELSLQAIQRRTVYIAKLDAPLKLLTDLSEKLLYLERRTQMLEILNKRLSGLPLAELNHDVAMAIDEQGEQTRHLSIDNVEVATPSLASLWSDFLKTRPKTAKAGASDGIDPTLNRKIAQEVCNGDYGRKYLLTSISGQTAACLAKWHGKDLYLNNLIELTPSAAKALTQWPGEWLSLNSLKSISADTARHLSQWPGKRLSLNGLNALSSSATAHLSKWHGEQLEMVGLTSIGRWENYGTRLYLSEALKRKLKMP